MSSAGLAEAVRAATSTSPGTHSVNGLPECRNTLVRMFGTLAGVAYIPGHAEIARRWASRVGSFTEVDLLDALMGLPVGLPVGWRELTDIERRSVARAPAGAVERRGDQVVRWAVAPLSIRFAVVAATDWRVGLKRAGQFAPFCARAVLLPASSAASSDLEAQASYFGIGVCAFVRRQLRMLVAPRPYVRRRHTPAQWWFAEEAFRQISEREYGEEPGHSMTTRREARPRL